MKADSSSGGQRAFCIDLNRYEADRDFTAELGDAEPGLNTAQTRQFWRSYPSASS